MGTKGDSVIMSGVLRYDEIYVIITFSVFMMPKAKKLWEDLQLNKTSRFYKLLKDISKISNDKSFYFSRAKFEGIIAVFTKFKEYLNKERKKERKKNGI